MGIRVRTRSDGSRAYQVRVDPFAAVTVDTLGAAERLELDLKLRKKLGPLHAETPTRLGDELAGFLERKRTTRNLRARTVEWYERSVKAWAPFERVRVSDLRRADVEDLVTARAGLAPVSARNELQVLKQALRQAESRGQRVDKGIYEIAPVACEARVGRALTAEELYELASWFPEHSRRLILVAGMVGARQRVWFELTDRMVDLDEGTLEIPAALAKNRRRQVIDLTDLETGLLREQLLARARGSRLVFPTKQGRRWTRHHFRDRVWTKALAAAAREHPAFAGLRFHDLRHTAGSLMALAGMDPAAAALRLGHTDGGALFLGTYRHLYRGEAKRQAAKLERLVRDQLRFSTGQERDTAERGSP